MALDSQLLHISAPPHIRMRRTVRDMMFWTICALLPATVVGFVFFGVNAALLVTCTVAGALITELLLCLAIRKPPTLGDGSAAITGLILGLSLPAGLPLWMGALGAVFAIAVVKFAFGGLGRNFLNPAMAGRAFLMLSFPKALSSFALPLLGTIDGLDGSSGATPLAHMRQLLAAGQCQPLDLQDALPRLIVGNIGGCIGETSAAALVLGAFILLYQRISSLRISVIYVGTTFVLFWLFNGTGAVFTSDGLIVPLYQILSGGLLLGAFFVANDPVTSPVTGWGKCIYAVGCGLLTFLFRRFSACPEGVTFAILAMNCAVPMLDRIIPRPFGLRAHRGRTT